MAKLNNLLVDSRYHNPWIVWKMTYQVTVPSTDENALPQINTINHNLPFIPLLVGQWSLNPNFNPSYDISVITPGGNNGGVREYICNTASTSTNVRFVLGNHSGTTKTFYFRLMAFAPPDYKGEVSPVEYSSKFRFNSHYRYPKIYMQGITSLGSVTHGLGYYPQALVWRKSGDLITKVESIIDSTSLQFSSATGDQHYYQIYLDSLE